MRLNDIDDEQLLGAGLMVLGAGLAASAVIIGLRAADHMAWAASLCGPTSGHCALCLVAGAMAVAAVAAGGAGATVLWSLPLLRPAVR